ncbi:lysozyme C, milk isozyme-like [Microcaecilia unicolor]|uniref:Lysozyme C, milk isozyme-like n=1 Tax=Microcaecilia unicolor TaxID=1415580 RepID=A0A6P7XNW8_9AMPH|nr:lysozyme C, milk isozyme-like [Microcaecilia unicolor]
MKTLTLLALLGICILKCEAIGKCEVVEAARWAGLDGVKGYSAANYACLAYYASYYDTSLNNSPTEFGIFQINGDWWCNYNWEENKPCNILCSDLLDSNIYDDILCVKRIVQDPNGLDAWTPWVQNCKGKDLSAFSC